MANHQTKGNKIKPDKKKTASHLGRQLLHQASPLTSTKVLTCGRLNLADGPILVQMAGLYLPARNEVSGVQMQVCKSWAIQACSQCTRSRIPDHPKRAVPGSAASAQSTIRRAGNRGLAYSLLQPSDCRLLRQGVARVWLGMWKKLPRMRRCRCTWTLGVSAYIKHGPHGRCPQAGAACCRLLQGEEGAGAASGGGLG